MDFGPNSLVSALGHAYKATYLFNLVGPGPMCDYDRARTANEDPTIGWNYYRNGLFYPMILRV